VNTTINTKIHTNQVHFGQKQRQSTIWITGEYYIVHDATFHKHFNSIVEYW